MAHTRIDELFERYAGSLQHWQIKLMLARLQRYHMPRSEWDDAMQDLAVVVLEFHFDPTKAHAASERTLLCRRLDQCIKMMARGNARRQACMSRLGDMSQAAGDAGVDVVESDPLHKAVELLPPLQQQICCELMHGRSVTQIATSTGRDVKTVNRHIQQIRRTFADRGLGE